MKYIIILTAIVSVILYYGIGELLWQLKNPAVKVRAKRLVIGVIIVALLASQLDIMSIFTKTDAETAAAAETDNTEIVTISAFSELPDDIKEQTVPIGTELTEIVLPDTLKAVCVVAGTDTEPNTDASDSDVERGVPENEDNAEDVTPGEETDTEDEAPENNPEDSSQAEEGDTEAENGRADDEEEDDNLIEEEQYPEVNNVEESEKKAAMQAVTDSFDMPEYYSEHIVEVKTLEDDSTAEEVYVEPEEIYDGQPSEDSEYETDSDTSELSQETIIIENITWQSEPEYDGDTEGEYIFTAVLPEGCVLTEEVNIPRITVTVGEMDNIALLSGDIMPIAITFDGGSGTEGNPYKISSLDTLQRFRDDVNKGTTYSGAYIKLTKDIDLAGSSTNRWTRIGTPDTPFKGTFDGGRYTISGLDMYYTDYNSVGLFGCVKGGTIKNLTVKGTVSTPNSGSPVIYNVGGIVGYISEGKIDNCISYTTISARNNVGGIVGRAGKDSEITNCINYGNVTGSAVVGGIVGKSDNLNPSGNYSGSAGTVSGCINWGTVTAAYAKEMTESDIDDNQGAGGIVGANHNKGVIKDCHNNAKVYGYGRVGGILGYNQSSNKGTITGCYNTGLVYGYKNGATGSTYGYDHGGIVGYAPNVDIQQCYNTGDVYGASNIGGIAGKIEIKGSSIKNSCSHGSINASTRNSGGIAGYTYNTVSITYCYSSGKLTSGTNCGGIVGNNGSTTYLTLGNCYWLSGTADYVCGASNNYASAGSNLTMEQTDLESGKFALVLQNSLESGAGLIWVQNLKNVYGDGEPTSKGPIPTGDSSLKVLTVTFMKKGSGTSYNTTHATRYTNPNFGVTMPTDLSPSNPSKYKVVWWTSTNAPASGKQFTADSTVTSDTTVYAYEQEMYAGESSTITKTVTYGNGGTITLSDSMQYAAGTSSANKFTYTINSGNTKLNATISGDTLTIPTTAGADTYTLTITAKEKSPQITTYALGSYGTSSVTLTVKVIINKANSGVTTKPAANSLTYTGAAQALVKAGTGTGGTMQYSTTGSSSGFSTTIPTGTDAGSYTVWYKVAGDDNHNDTTPQFVTVTINRAQVGGTLSIDGTLKYGEILKGNMSGILPSGAKASDFTYTWKRDNVTISGATSSDYTLTKDDIGYTLTLTATAKVDGNYTGSVTSAKTGTIKKADSPEVSGVSKTNETVKGKKDGTLTGLKTTMEYKLSTAGSYTVVTTAGTVSGLAPGIYYVRVKETDTHNAGVYNSFTIEEGAALTVQFNSNGGSIVSDTTGISYNTAITAPKAPVREGYTFDGWYKESGLTNKWDFANDKVTENITLYAKWTTNGYKIIYKDAGGADFSGQFEGAYPTTHTYGTETVLISPAKTGYSFKGWYTASDCTGNPVTSLTATGHTADITLYAKWVDVTAPELSLTYSYEPTVFMDWVIGNRNLVITVNVTEEGSGADVINYTVTESSKEQVEKNTAAIDDGAATLTVNADFKGNIRITCTDKEKNTSEEVTVGEEFVGKDNFKGIIIEEHAPQISITNGSEEISSSVYYDPEELNNLTVSITDEVNDRGSDIISGGIASITYNIGNGTEKSVDENFTTGMLTKCSFIIPSSDLHTGANKITVTATDNAGNTKRVSFTVHVRGPEMMPDARIDFTLETLTGLIDGEEYTVGGVTKTANADGTIPIEESWVGTTISIVKCGVGNETTPSEAQSLDIPARPAAPAAPVLSERTDTSIILETITGAEYRIGVGPWQSSTTFDGLTQKTQYSFEAYFPATQSSFCSPISESVTIATRPMPPTTDKLNIDYIEETFSLASGVEAFSDAGASSSVTAGNIESYMGEIVYIRYAAVGDFPESDITAVSIPDRPDAPAGFTANNATYPGAKDGNVTGLYTVYTYELSDDYGSTWKDAQWNGTAITGLSAGSYRIRIKAATGRNFQSEPSDTFTIGEDQPSQEETPNVSVDKENGLLKGLDKDAEYNITYTDETGTEHTVSRKSDENGNLKIEDDWLGDNVDIVKKGNGTTKTDSDKQTLRIPAKEKKPSPKTTKASAKGKSDGKITDLEPNETYEISRDGGKTWETKIANGKGEITGLPAGDYKIRTKAKDDADGGTLCSDVADCKIGTKSSSKGSDGSSGSGGNGNSGDSSGTGGGNDNSGGSSGSGGDDNSGGQPNVDGGNAQTDNTTPDTVTPPTDTKTPETDTPPSDTPKKETPKNKETKQNTDKRTEDSGKPGQSNKPGTNPDTKSSAETTEQTATAETENDAINITGDYIATGTIKAAQNTTTSLTVGAGSVIVTVVSDEFRSGAGVADTVAVANAVLTQEHKQLVNGGETIELRFDVKDISDQVSKEDKDIIGNGLTAENKDEELALGAYIDISIFIKIGDGDWKEVTQSDEPIDVVIGIPDELQTDGRTFYIARCHEGEYALLNDMDTEAETITMQTELFSTYAIVYSQAGTAGNTAGKCGLCHICPTFLGICCFIWLAVITVAVIAVILIVSIRRKNEKRIY